MKFDHPSRRKHGLWHRHVAALLRDAMPEIAGAPVSDADLHAYERGLDVPVFSLATRIGLAPNLRRTMCDALKNLPPDRLPLAVVHDEAQGMEFALMPFEAFRLLIAAWWAATQQPSSLTPQPASSKSEE